MALHIAFPTLCRKRPHAEKKGFTLIEMAIVLVIIAVVVGVSMNVWRGKMDEAQVMQTRLKIAQIQKALMTYRRANDRLPCPADPTAVQNTANYGVAVTPPGACNSAAGVIGNTTLPVFAVEGSVPYQTLNLPEDFMYDGWGKRIAYAVDPRMTEDEAFTNYDIYANCGGITVKDATGNPVTSSAIYAVISFGSNSHGAYTRGGTRYNGGSVNADELTNCNCTNNGTYSGSYGGIYIQKPMMGTGNATFDDMVEYQERWQLQTDADNVYGSYGGPEVGFSLSVSPYVKFYTKSCDTYTALNDPAALPPAAATGISVSPDNLY
ncbi:MAG: prepilin-type N-terminal cleavage/methylation domain-containing protein, partial [Alphaproteobacteria bacterium]|nr:prepilin-type N-terminal cleavage/methylation domain-containing protein [Alphaproteobacteria bacterium]